MKNIFFASIFYTLVLSANAQSTWVQRLNFSDLSPYVNPGDSLTGIKDIQIGADQDIYVLATVGLSNKQTLFKISPNGAPIRWSYFAGSHGGLTGSFTNSVYPTADSGCVISFNYWGQSMCFHTDGQIIKLSKTGVVQWQHGFSGHCSSPPYYDNEAYNVIETNAGNYYAFVGDTLYKFNNSGTTTDYNVISGRKIFELPNGDLLIQLSSNVVERIDTTGSIIWSKPSTILLGCTTTHIFISSAAGIQKTDLNGSIIWTKNYPWTITDLDPTADGGFVASYGARPNNINNSGGVATQGQIRRVDTAGDTVWTKTYNFPYYGLPAVKLHPTGNIITGGAFLFTNSDHTFFTRDYSALIASLDSMGNGPLQTCSQMWPGDANNNRLISFIDDALNVSIALGDTGPLRDTINSAQFYFRAMKSDYASDWTNFYFNGVNHKHADFNGDGVIDTNDLSPLGNTYPYPLNIPNWRLGQGNNFISTIPEFKLVPEHDTVQPGDLIRCYVTVGNNAPVDSLYGILFSMLYDNTLLDSFPANVITNSDFGSPGVDLTSYKWSNTFYLGQPVYRSMHCRTNHQNVFNLNDTILEIDMTASNSITSPQYLDLTIPELKAMTYNEYNISFNPVSASILIVPTILPVVEPAPCSIVYYPNPVSNMLYIEQLCHEDASVFSIYNYLGEKVKTINLFDAERSINIEELPDGIYTGIISSASRVKNISFVIQH